MTGLGVLASRPLPTAPPPAHPPIPGWPAAQPPEYRATAPNGSGPVVAFVVEDDVYYDANGGIVRHDHHSFAESDRATARDRYDNAAHATALAVTSITLGSVTSGSLMVSNGAARFCGCFVRPTARLVIRADGRAEPIGYSQRRRNVGRTDRRDLISHLIKQVEQVPRTRACSSNEDWFAELRCRNARGGVIDHELHRVAAAPCVAAKVTGDMDRHTAGLGEKMAERRLRGAEGDRR